MAEQPVTAAVTRTVLPGKQETFEAWVKGVTAEASQVPGHLGVELIRPSAGQRTNVLIFRYDSREHLATWEASPARAAWLQKAAAFTEGEAAYETVTGLEYWFRLPAEAAKTPPSPAKMAFVTWLAIFPLSYWLPLWLRPWLVPLAPLPRTMLVAALLVILMTWLVMPLMTRLFARWLFPLPTRK